jgi:multiple sugar transport system permease protein
MLKKKNIVPYYYIIPVLVLILFLAIYPSIYTIRMSLFSTGASLSEIEFVGLRNFINFFKSVTFWKAFLITIEFTIAAVLLELIIGTAAAVLIKRIKVGSIFFRTLFIIPLAVSPAIAGLTWRMLYSPSFGVLNYLLSKIGIEGILWHVGNRTALLSVIIADVWQWTPFVIIIMYAGLRAVPKEIIESSHLDGCSNIGSFFRVIVPFLRPVITLIVVFRGLDAFRAFDIILTLTKGGPARATETLTMKAFIDAFYNFQLGKAAAVSVILLIISMFITQTVIKRIIKS